MNIFYGKLNSVFIPCPFLYFGVVTLAIMEMAVNNLPSKDFIAKLIRGIDYNLLHRFTSICIYLQENMQHVMYNMYCIYRYVLVLKRS